MVQVVSTGVVTGAQVLCVGGLGPPGIIFNVVCVGLGGGGGRAAMAMPGILVFMLLNLVFFYLQHRGLLASPQEQSGRVQVRGLPSGPRTFGDG